MSLRDKMRCFYEVFFTFLVLGCTSFGGPIAHLSYFRTECVLRRRWVTEQDYADLVALCQFLPGPASSQVGFALGLSRAGLGGALLAWLAFTLPSALLMIVFAYSAHLLGGEHGQNVITGLKLVAVAVVSHAVWGMARNLCPDGRRAGIAVAAIAAVVFLPSAIGQVFAILLGALLGGWICRDIQQSVGSGLDFSLSRRQAAVLLMLFTLLLVGLPLLIIVLPIHAMELFDAFYRSGALVFGGGHVVLPLLESRLVETGWVSADAFLSGYGVTQAMPGPLFTFAAYLGAVNLEFGGLAGACIALLGIFLPGMLLLLGVLPFWAQLRKYSLALPLMAGANAGVVGILAAALYNPVWISAVKEPVHFLIVTASFVCLAVWRIAPLWVVIGTVAATFMLH